MIIVCVCFAMVDFELRMPPHAFAAGSDEKLDKVAETQMDMYALMLMRTGVPNELKLYRKIDSGFRLISEYQPSDLGFISLRDFSGLNDELVIMFRGFSKEDQSIDAFICKPSDCAATKQSVGYLADSDEMLRLWNDPSTETVLLVIEKQGVMLEYRSINWLSGETTEVDLGAASNGEDVGIDNEVTRLDGCINFSGIRSGMGMDDEVVVKENRLKPAKFNSLNLPRACD